MQNWNESPPRSENGHSTREIEHRFTESELRHLSHSEDLSELFQISEKHGEKLSTHEKAILAIIIALSSLLQDKFPKLAALLKGMT